MKRETLDLSLSLGLLAGAVLMLAEAATIRAPANVFPLVIISATGLLAGVNAFRAMVALREGAGAAARQPAGDGPRVLVFVAAIVLYALLLPLGYVPVTFVLLMVLYVYLEGRLTARRLLYHAAMAAFIVLVTFSIFRTWLGVNLPLTGLGLWF